jgi:hypothetical protein
MGEAGHGSRRETGQIKLPSGAASLRLTEYHQFDMVHCCRAAGPRDGIGFIPNSEIGRDGASTLRSSTAEGGEDGRAETAQRAVPTTIYTRPTSEFRFIVPI